MLADMYLSDGRPVPFDTRTVLRRTLRELADEGYDYVAGLEVEWYIGPPRSHASTRRGGS
jgi:glutamine synthetase